MRGCSTDSVPSHSSSTAPAAMAALFRAAKVVRPSALTRSVHCCGVYFAESSNLEKNASGVGFSVARRISVYRAMSSDGAGLGTR